LRTKNKKAEYTLLLSPAAALLIKK